MAARRRMNFPKAVKREALARAAGRCEGLFESGERCPVELRAPFFQFDHVIADGLRGRPTLDNCEVVCTPCHRAKTAGDVRLIAQAKRREVRHVGLACPHYRPMPGARTSNVSIGLDRVVRDRDTGEVRSRPASIDVRSL